MSVASTKGRAGAGPCRESPRGIDAASGTHATDRPDRHARPRYALIVTYHYCHPSDGFLSGTKGIAPDDLDRHLRALTQTFVCTTIGNLLDPESDLPDAVAVVTFDDGLKDVSEYALPILKRWNVPATIYCNSAPLMERRILNVHQVHLLQARLGMETFRQEFQGALASLGDLGGPAPPVPVQHLYPYDDEVTRRFKRLLNFELPYPIVDAVLERLFERFIGCVEQLVPKVYMSGDDIRRCQDAGLEIGVHCHAHRVLSRLSDEEQRREIQVAAEYFTHEFQVRALHCSYPYGAPGTWNDMTKRLLVEHGFSSAVTKIRTIAEPPDLHARWELPRFDVRDAFDGTGNLAGDALRAILARPHLCQQCGASAQMRQF